MSNPVLVEVWRGERVESAHCGAYAVMDATGELIDSAGDIERFIYPRSAVKPFQALPLVQSGAADAYGFGPKELALACASHNGEAEHVAIVTAMLDGAGLVESDLECGEHWSLSQAVAIETAASGGTPHPAAHNCSGKHVGLLAAARHGGHETAGYVAPGHPVQRHVAEAFRQLTGFDVAKFAPALDGCSVPCWALPLGALALGCARFATGEGLKPEMKTASARIYDAAVAHPYLVAGRGRFCTRAMEGLPGQALVKTGAEGVYCVMAREKGLGIAVKIDDGATRAAEAVTAALLVRHGIADVGNEAIAIAPIMTLRGVGAGHIAVTF